MEVAINFLFKAVIMNKYWFQKILFMFCIGVTNSISLPVVAAERVSFWYGALQFSVSVQSLEIFVNEGKVTGDLGFYSQYIKPDELQTWRGFLQTRLDFNSVILSQFTYSPVGEKILKRLGDIFQTDAQLNGFHALRSSLILSAADSKEGLTILNVLRRFPSHNVRLEINKGFEIANNTAELIQKKGLVVAAIHKVSETESASSQNLSGDDLRKPGIFKSQKQILNLSDRLRNRNFEADLYLPQSNEPIPLIVISHGIGEDRDSFAYLADHLSSYGFAVAVLEHPGSDAKKVREYFAGLTSSPEPMELINQPLDVKFLLDELQTNISLKDRLNLQQVGLIGHSQGGYAVLALAGAKLDFENLQKDCADNQSLNLSLFVQCDAMKLPERNYALQDPRVKAAIAINPLSSSIFGQAGMSQIQIPLMLVASSEDVLTPVVAEQVRPFAWLTQPHKYLLMIENGTHFSVLQPTKNSLKLPIPVDIIGPNPEIARSYISVMSLAFFRRQLSQDISYDSYLSAAYVKSLSQPPLNLSLVKSFTLDDLAKALTAN
jgi:predicted dienelactone hydrolase